MQEAIQRAIALLAEALPLTETDSEQAKTAVGQAVRELLTIFPNQPVGPDFPDGPNPDNGGGGGDDDDDGEE